jgi:SNF2 family DNA or RNA helicase
MVNPDLSGSGSGKLEQVTQKLRVLVDEGHKILVISSYIKHLAFVSGWLKEAGITYEELTGRTLNHQEVITRFKTDTSIRVMLLTLKKGGYGLNLTEADYVLILDPWWNPAAQQQGTDRVYRIGQDKPVFVYKFITVGTVEEKILQLQRNKKRIADSVIGINNPLHLLTREHLAGLLSGNDR